MLIPDVQVDRRCPYALWLAARKQGNDWQGVAGSVSDYPKEVLNICALGGAHQQAAVEHLGVMAAERLNSLGLHFLVRDPTRNSSCRRDWPHSCHAVHARHTCQDNFLPRKTLVAAGEDVGAPGINSARVHSCPMFVEFASGGQAPMHSPVTIIPPVPGSSARGHAKVIHYQFLRIPHKISVSEKTNAQR
ncbi:hypothetical protein FH972_025648 [Carpinus fangiana]|uniref:Uncharacterized protein n=1 Tax=Carpinus fangiana TaxID=176857 RepID=A0A5N6L2L7_9ROSI|nr:hypothetical protein FH972_025648 [Carpinus fangiana]